MIEFSISEIAAELGQARATVSKRLAAGNAEPSGERKGAPVYSLREVIRCLGAAATGKSPGQMNAFELRAFYAAERDRLKLGVEAGDLMPRSDSTWPADQQRAFEVWRADLIEAQARRRAAG